MPACARTFCSRSLIPPRRRRIDPRRRPRGGRGRRRSAPSELVEVLDRRQVLEAIQPEVDEEVLRRPVEQRVADDLLPPEDPHQLRSSRFLSAPDGIDAADRLDLGRGDRLPVGDDRQRLERRRREPRAVALAEELPHPAADLGRVARRNAPATCSTSSPPRPLATRAWSASIAAATSARVGSREGRGDLRGPTGSPAANSTASTRRRSTPGSAPAAASLTMSLPARLASRSAIRISPSGRAGTATMICSRDHLEHREERRDPLDAIRQLREQLEQVDDPRSSSRSVSQPILSATDTSSRRQLELARSSSSRPSSLRNAASRSNRSTASSSSPANSAGCARRASRPGCARCRSPGGSRPPA